MYKVVLKNLDTIQAFLNKKKNKIYYLFYLLLVCITKNQLYFKTKFSYTTNNGPFKKYMTECNNANEKNTSFAITFTSNVKLKSSTNTSKHFIIALYFMSIEYTLQTVEDRNKITQVVSF